MVGKNTLGLAREVNAGTKTGKLCGAGNLFKKKTSETPNRARKKFGAGEGKKKATWGGGRASARGPVWRKRGEGARKKEFKRCRKTNSDKNRRKWGGKGKATPG